MRILGKFVKSVKLAFLLPAGPMDIVCPTATRKIPRIRHPRTLDDRSHGLRQMGSRMSAKGKRAAPFRK